MCQYSTVLQREGGENKQHKIRLLQKRQKDKCLMRKYKQKKKKEIFANEMP